MPDSPWARPNRWEARSSRKPGSGRANLRGRFAGHFLSTSMLLAANGDTGAKAKGEYFVAELAKCQQDLGGKT
jgi:hypothetical protein